MKHNERTKHFFIKIYLSFHSRKGQKFVGNREIDGEPYIQRREFFLSYIFFREPGDANACTPLQAVSSEMT